MAAIRLFDAASAGMCVCISLFLSRPHRTQYKAITLGCGGVDFMPSSHLRVFQLYNVTLAGPQLPWVQSIVQKQWQSLSKNAKLTNFAVQESFSILR